LFFCIASNYDVIEAKHTGAAAFVNPVVAYGYAGLTPPCPYGFRFFVYLCFSPVFAFVCQKEFEGEDGLLPFL